MVIQPTQLAPFFWLLLVTTDVLALHSVAVPAVREAVETELSYRNT